MSVAVILYALVAIGFLVEAHQLIRVLRRREEPCPASAYEESQRLSISIPVEADHVGAREPAQVDLLKALDEEFAIVGQYEYRIDETPTKTN